MPTYFDSYHFGPIARPGLIRKIVRYLNATRERNLFVNKQCTFLKARSIRFPVRGNFIFALDKASDEILGNVEIKEGDDALEKQLEMFFAIDFDTTTVVKSSSKNTLSDVINDRAESTLCIVAHDQEFKDAVSACEKYGEIREEYVLGSVASSLYAIRELEIAFVPLTDAVFDDLGMQEFYRKSSSPKVMKESVNDLITRYCEQLELYQDDRN